MVVLLREQLLPYGHLSCSVLDVVINGSVAHFTAEGALAAFRWLLHAGLASIAARGAGSATLHSRTVAPAFAAPSAAAWTRACMVPVALQ
jgi:hypothetical protein